MIDLKNSIVELNNKLLTATHNNFDLTNYINNFQGIANINFESIINENKLPALITEGNITARIDKDLYDILSELLAKDPHNIEIKKVLTKRILFIGAESEKHSQIRVDNEYKLLKKKLSNPFIKISKVKPASFAEICKQWEEYKPQILFFSCHGAENCLYLQDINENSVEIPNNKIAEFVNDRVEYNECIILSACSSSSLGQSIQTMGKNVICMNSEIDINTAKTFTEKFLEYLNSHSFSDKTIYEQAFSYAKEIIDLSQLKDNQVIEFYKTSIKL